MTNNNTGEYRGLIYESEAELWFLYWAFELKDRGIIKLIRRAETFPLTQGLDNNYIEVDKKGRRIERKQILLRPSVYTPEFHIEWDIESAHLSKLVWITEGKCLAPLIGQYRTGSLITLVECKPDFDQNNMTRLFKNNQKFMWDKHEIFVNLVKIKEFFEKTFTPALFLRTRTGKDRKLGYTPRTINEYLNDN